eukprot:gene11007-19848_t
MADASKVNKPSGKKNTGAKAKTTAFKWTVEMVNDMLDFLLEHKTEIEYNNIDFNADKVQLYEAIRLKMARKYSEAEGSMFGPTSKVDGEDIEKYKTRCEEDKIKVTKGYSRIKEKIKELRQKFNNAVTLGTRSGSGKLVLEFYDLMVQIWGGAPATEPVSFGVMTAEEEVQRPDAAEYGDHTQEEEEGNDFLECLATNIDRPTYSSTPSSKTILKHLVRNEREQKVQLLPLLTIKEKTWNGNFLLHFVIGSSFLLLVLCYF